jgi:hypothetical protein
VNQSGKWSAAAERSRWLAELAEAVDQAQRLARALSTAGSDGAQAKELFHRLESVRVEVDSLRRGAWVKRSTEIDPFLTNLFPWNRRQKY